MHAILALVLWLATPSLTWYEHYDRGVRLIEQPPNLCTIAGHILGDGCHRQRFGQDALLS